MIHAFVSHKLLLSKARIVVTRFVCYTLALAHICHSMQHGHVRILVHARGRGLHECVLFLPRLSVVILFLYIFVYAYRSVGVHRCIYIHVHVYFI